MTVRIYGQAPSRSSDPRRPLSGRSGKRLAGLVGLTYDELVARAELRNLFSYYPGPAAHGKGDRFDQRDASLSAGYEIARWENLDRIVLLGRKVAAAFRVERDFLEEFSWMILDDDRWALGKVVECVVLPHPSGVVTFWNEEANRAAAAEVLSVFLGLDEEGEEVADAA